MKSIAPTPQAVNSQYLGPLKNLRARLLGGIWEQPPRVDLDGDEIRVALGLVEDRLATLTLKQDMEALEHELLPGATTCTRDGAFSQRSSEAKARMAYHDLNVVVSEALQGLHGVLSLLGMPADKCPVFRTEIKSILGGTCFRLEAVQGEIAEWAPTLEEVTQ